MALSPEDLQQVRMVMRSELEQRFSLGRVAKNILILFLGTFLAVLVLHVLVIAGFTVYHLIR